MRGEIVVVRHGETEWSRAGRHTSRTDLPLTPAGRERAAALAPLLAERTFVRVLCSPLLRARETCEQAGFGEVAELGEELREWDYGDYEGLTSAQIQADRPGWSLWRDGCAGGESPRQVARRAEAALAVLAPDEGDTLAFAHGHILRVMAACWLEMPVQTASRLALGAGSISALGFERETNVIAHWNMVNG